MPELEQLSRRFAALIARVRCSVVTVRGTKTSGAGVKISDGLVVTAAHVLAGQGRCHILGERGFRPVIVEKEDWDLAIVDGRGLDRPCLPLARRVSVGELAIGVGAAFDVEGLSTIGVISGFARGYRLGDRTITDVIKSDVPAAPGCSGGALANVRGELIGIVIGGTRDGGLSVSVGANRVNLLAQSCRGVIEAWRA